MQRADGPVLGVSAVTTNVHYNPTKNRQYARFLRIIATGLNGNQKIKRGLTMNNRNEFVESFEDVHKYIQKMVDNAKKHGIMVTAVFVNAPLLDKGVDCITPYGRKHPELLIHSCAKAGLEMVNQCEDSIGGLFEGEYE